ncbi:MAG: RHS repeat domain-containing protein [Fimbriimonadaceae bacterium]
MTTHTTQRLSNLVRVSMAYDAGDRLVRLANVTSTGTTITSFRDTWDGAGNRLHRVENDGTLVTWTYDATNQLIRERRNGGNSYDTTYSYDAAGNRLVKLDNSVRTTYTCDAVNQLSKFVDSSGNRTTFSYDATGNQRTQQVPGGGITTNTWDLENRLTKVALPSGTVNTFTYNGDGQRVKRQDSTGTLKEVWDSEKILLETDQSNVTQVIYTLSPGIYGDLISQRRSGVSRYFLFDPLGSASRLTDGSQNVTDSYLFKAFGESLLAAGPTTNPFQFVGKQGYYVNHDLPSMTLRAREYNATIARFMSKDPLGFSMLNTNVFIYVRNQATRRFDPSGLVDTACCHFWDDNGYTWLQTVSCPGNTDPSTFPGPGSKTWACCKSVATGLGILPSWHFVITAPGDCGGPNQLTIASPPAGGSGPGGGPYLAPFLCVCNSYTFTLGFWSWNGGPSCDHYFISQINNECCDHCCGTYAVATAPWTVSVDVLNACMNDCVPETVMGSGQCNWIF